MFRYITLSFIVILGFSSSAIAQKSKVIAAFQLIETEKFKEAKDAIEDAIEEKSTMDWHRTWHARGLLCQNAYEKGKKENNKDLYQLYPNQLFTAYESYKKAIEFDKRGRLIDPLAPEFIRLANDFQNLGEERFKQENYTDALTAFENALEISKDPILSVQVDDNLIYNTALAAYEAKEWDKATDYLKMLNRGKYSPNVPHLLYTAYLQMEDTTGARQVLIEGIDQYEKNEDMILLLADLYVNSGESVKAIEILDEASVTYSDNAIFPFTMGLVYQKMSNFKDAIPAYKRAASVNPDDLKTYKSIGVCYYNLGVVINENARSISNLNKYRIEKDKASGMFRKSLEWYEKAFNRNPEDPDVISKLYELYKFLGLNEKADKIADQF